MNDFIKILIAEDNDISREMMASTLRTKGYTVLQATDGQAGIDLLKEHDVHLALVDVNMAPLGGLEFAKHLLVNSIDIPLVFITSETSSDLLSRAIDLGVQKVVQKPITPQLLLKTVHRILERRGHNPNALAVQSYETKHSHKDLMERAIDLAKRNAQSGKGRPFGAIVASDEGQVLGEGTNGIASQVDPTAHAEIMAIRQAAELLGQSDLSKCILYCSSEPTMMGQALILSVGIEQVYYGLSHKEISDLNKTEERVRIQLNKKNETLYKQLCHDEAVQMLKECKK